MIVFFREEFMKMKNSKNLYFTSIFCLLSTVLCIYRGDGPGHSFDIYNNTNETIIVDYREDVSGYTDERFEVGPHQKKEHFSGGFSNEKRKTSYFFEYIKITQKDGTTLLDLKGEALDVHFKVVEEGEYFIDYRLDVN